MHLICMIFLTLYGSHTVVELTYYEKHTLHFKLKFLFFAFDNIIYLSFYLSQKLNYVMGLMGKNDFGIC